MHPNTHSDTPDQPLRMQANHLQCLAKVAAPSAANGTGKELIKTEATRLEAVGQELLAAIGEDRSREGLRRTPERFAKALTELCAGYQQTVKEVVGEGVFAAEGRGLVAVREVEFYSMCEHHVLPFWGKVAVAYLPGEKILGLSKVPRIVDCFAKRLQVQERLTREIAEGIAEVVRPRAVAVRIVAEHMCMRMRGVEKQGGATLTEYLLEGERIAAEDKARLWASLV